MKRPLCHTELGMTVWGAVLFALAGYCLVFHAGEERISERIVMNERLEDQLRADTMAIAGGPALLGERNRLRDTGHGTATTARVAAFLADVNKSATRHHAVLSTVAVRAARDFFGTRELAPISLSLTVEGRFADILATIRVLSTATAPAAIDLTTIRRKNGDPLDVTLTASLRVEIEPAPRGPAISKPLSLPRIEPRRDPFDRLAMPGAQAPAIAAAIVPIRLNLGETRFASVSNTRMTAIVTSSHAFALVDANGTTRMVTIGDEVAGSRIRAIRDDGLWLANGTRVPIAARKAPRHASRRGALLLRLTPSCERP